MAYSEYLGQIHMLEEVFGCEGRDMMSWSLTRIGKDREQLKSRIADAFKSQYASDRQKEKLAAAVATLVDAFAPDGAQADVHLHVDTSGHLNGDGSGIAKIQISSLPSACVST